ncbi:hypothetical protein [Penaeicola halotolerans]|uniref:hypothetical protein n=1 Tax=Penaeicola halotolerans TaxID=2793196 RepID=UPI001CF83EC8|nr:hypothetical protein [Penaeicola halotolerans]
MELSRLQIDIIRERVRKTPLYYTDLVEELTDHIAEQLTHDPRLNEDNFDVLLNEAVDLIQPSNFQMRALLNSHLGALIQLSTAWKKLLTSYRVIYILAIGALVYMTYQQSFVPVDDMIKLLRTGLLAIILPLLTVSLFKRDYLKRSKVVSIGNTFWLSLVLISTLIGFISVFTSAPALVISLITLSITHIIIGYQCVINQAKLSMA